MDIKNLLKTNPVIASVSGGKDSTAICLFLREKELRYKAIHLATYWESPITDEYIKYYLSKKIGPIETIETIGMEKLILKKGMFPSRTIRFCTQQLKVFPYIEWIENQNFKLKPITVTGIRAEESKRRSKLKEVEEQEFSIHYRPLLNWTEKRVIDLHLKHNIEPNPLYLKGNSRVGCYPCIFSRKKELQKVAEFAPERISLIRQLEEKLGYTYFQNGPIDQMVAWSQTSHGGRQFEFAFEDRSGCLNWGLCDH